ncbi:MAG: response regulator [Gemmatimonadetes bacterium]|nr:response regulator [Gemmatimonadota bacterium]
MSRVLIAGLPTGLASWLAQRLPDALVQVTYSGEDTLEELRGGDWALLVVDDSLPGLPAKEVLRWTRTEPALAGLRTIYCLEPEANGGAALEELVSRLGADQILLHPLDRGELTRHAATLIARGGGGRQSVTAPAPPPPPSPAPPAAPTSSELRSVVAEVWARSRGAVIARVDTLERAVVAVLQGTLLGAQRHEAEREAHKLAGALGTFGFPRGSQIALQLEGVFGGGNRLTPRDGARLSELVAAMRRELEEGSTPAPAPSAPAPQPAPAATAAGDRPLVLVVDDDRELALLLAEEGKRQGMEVARAADLASARSVLAGRRPDAVILDLTFPEEGEDGRTLLAELGQRFPGLPVLVSTGRNSLVDRVRALQLGARGFLNKPFTPTQAMEAVTRTIPRLGGRAEVRILAVDDDPQILDALRALLEPHGIRVQGLENPLRFWTTLEEASPDLVVLDVDMPYLSGIELCRVLRSDLKRGNLPVVFLTASTDPDTVYRVFAAGADDYVAKPIIGPELVARIRNRLERAQARAVPPA